MQHCYGTVRFIICNTDVIEPFERKFEGKSFFFNLTKAELQLGTYGTASHHAIIQPWNQH